jgi:flavin-dependent dehydrogenase
VQLSNNTKHILCGDTRVRPFYIEGDYSYKMSKFAGDGWMLVGDAARFVDPIFSSGVSVAVNSAKFAFEAIEEAVKTGDSISPLAAYNDKVQHGVAIWYEWITIYYRLQSLFTYLGRDPKNKAEMQKLLQGDVYDEDAVEVLDRMKALVKAVEDDPNHLLRAHLNDNVTVVTAS